MSLYNASVGAHSHTTGSATAREILLLTSNLQFPCSSAAALPPLTDFAEQRRLRPPRAPGSARATGRSDAPRSYSQPGVMWFGELVPYAYELTVYTTWSWGAIWRK
ncbi:hypothetical protein [Streptomyces sp. TP-A0356]|uniref:hypothetical protein n=1 Tax=Streptomyces sp. TP-A0356 TaxID=1359208 RepID=UPI0006E21876|nr:hypothetical protein [Streptomyces sp. TP-A0356]